MFNSVFNPAKSVRLGLRIDQLLLVRLQAISNNTGVPVSAVVRALLRDAINQLPREAYTNATDQLPKETNNTTTQA